MPVKEKIVYISITNNLSLRFFLMNIRDITPKEIKYVEEVSLRPVATPIINAAKDSDFISSFSTER